MLVDVLPWRVQGRRIREKDMAGLNPYRGTLRLLSAPSGSDRPIAAHLIAQGGVSKDLIAPLHEPILTLIGVDGFVLRGIERLELPDGVHGVVQEWRCTVAVR